MWKEQVYTYHPVYKIIYELLPPLWLLGWDVYLILTTIKRPIIILWIVLQGMAGIFLLGTPLGIITDNIELFIERRKKDAN